MRRLTAGPRGGRRTSPPSTTARNAELTSSAPQRPLGLYHLYSQLSIPSSPNTTSRGGTSRNTPRRMPSAITDSTPLS